MKRRKRKNDGHGSYFAQSRIKASERRDRRNLSLLRRDQSGTCSCLQRLKVSAREVLRALVARVFLSMRHSPTTLHNRIGLTWGSDVEGWLLSNCDLRFGARSIHHQVERHVIRKLALGIQEQEVSSGDNVVLRVSDGSISLKVIKPRKPVTPPASTSTPQPASHPVSTPHPVSQRIPVGVHQPMRRPAPFSPESSSISDQMERYLTGSLSPRFASEPAPGFDATGLAPTAPAGFHALAPIQETVNAPAGFHALAPIQETVHIPPHLLGAQQPQMGEQVCAFSPPLLTFVLACLVAKDVRRCAVSPPFAPTRTLLWRPSKAQISHPSFLGINNPQHPSPTLTD